VLMGSNLVIHKFLCAYCALYERDPGLFTKVTMKLYICPEGHNDLGRFLAWTDKWYQRHVYAPFVSSVPLAPQYSVKETFPASLLEECEMQSTLPVNLLREMLQHYVRCAEHTENIRVYDVQCWTEQHAGLRRMSMTNTQFLDDDVFSDGDKEGGSRASMDGGKSPGGGGGGGGAAKEEGSAGPVFALSPNLLVPFVTSMEIGILSQVEAYKFSMMKQDNTLKDILGDKEFIRTHGGGDFPNLTISYQSANLNQKATKDVKYISGEFVSISVCNVPEGIRGFETSQIDEEEKFGTWSGLTLCVRRNQGPLKALLAQGGGKNKLTAAEADRYIDIMKSTDSFGMQSIDEEVDPKASKVLLVGTVSVHVTNPKDSFYILVDGALVGPLKKITVGQSALKHDHGKATAFDIPVQSFFPVAAFNRNDEEKGRRKKEGQKEGGVGGVGGGGD
jgi:hypothetical protein